MATGILGNAISSYLAPKDVSYLPGGMTQDQYNATSGVNNYAPNYTLANGVQGYAAPGSAYANSLGIPAGGGGMYGATGAAPSAGSALDQTMQGNQYYFNQAANSFAQQNSNTMRRRGFTQGSGVAQQGLQSGLTNLTNQFTAQNLQSALDWYKLQQQQNEFNIDQANQAAQANQAGRGSMYTGILGLLGLGKSTIGGSLLGGLFGL